MADPHPDDELHPPASADPEWTETCWFTFTVPERRLSGQLYPFLMTNQRVGAGGAYFWDERGDQPWNCIYAKNFWHLPLPAGSRLSDLSLANGIRYRCLEPLTRYALAYAEPGVDELSLQLEFAAIAPPHYLGGSHLDQPGRYRGWIRLRGEEIRVDSFGFRDRSWGPRSQFGAGIGGTPAQHGGYSYATASDRDAFHTITLDLGAGCVSIHGYLIRDGVWSKLAQAKREVVERDPTSGFPLRVRIEGVDERGRRLEASGRCLNRLGFYINPNLFTVNCLTEWSFGGVTAYGEDHDNWSAAGIRAFARRHLGYSS